MDKRVLYIGLGFVALSLLLAKGKAAFNMFNEYLGQKNLVRSIRTANPLSVKISKNRTYLGQTGNDGLQVVFVDVVHGLAGGIAHMVDRYIKGNLYKSGQPKLNTIDKILNAWAPSYQNATQDYIKFVENKSGYNRHYIILPGDYTALKKITRAMAIFENGGQYGKEGNIFSESNWEGLFAAAWPIAQKQI